jgi:hypothetical protein
MTNVNVSKIYGKIQLVDATPDYRVQVVAAVADLRVQRVSAAPMSARQWQM